MRQTDFPELAKKEIEYITRYSLKKTALVVDANYFVGITIVDKNDPNKILFCCNYKNTVKCDKVDEYTDLFYSAIEQIKTEKVDEQVFINIINHYSGQIVQNADICPWK